MWQVNESDGNDNTANVCVEQHVERCKYTLRNHQRMSLICYSLLRAMLLDIYTAQQILVLLMLIFT